jgi:hypothetical protein
MTPAERKAIGYIVRQSCDLYAATMGDKPIWDNRHRMREGIGQRVDAEMALLDVPGSLAEWIVAANRMREGIGQRVDAEMALLDVPGSLAEWIVAANRTESEKVNP